MINSVFENYYGILVLVLFLMVPVWFARFVFEAVATILHRRRQRR